MKKLGFIGAGNMASAMIAGIVQSGLLAPPEILVTALHHETRARFARQGFAVAENAKQVCEESQYVVLAVKPQTLPEILKAIAPSFSEDRVILSIAAGISEAFLAKQLSCPQAKVVLAMPNTPLLIGAGAVAVARGSFVSDQEFAFAKSIFSCSGAVEEISPHQMNAIIPFNGSSPAFLYFFTQILENYAKELGLDSEKAVHLFCHTLIGSARMMLETGKTRQELIDMVCSPGGTTLKGLEALEDCGFQTAVTEACRRCIARANELERV